MRAAILTLAALSLTAPLAAQTLRPTLPEGWAFGASVGRFSLEGEHYLETTLHITRLQPGRFTPEFDVGFYPQFLKSGLLLTPDLGLAYNLALPGATLLLKGGASGIFAFGDGAAALPGFHGGAALLIPVVPGFGLRLEGLYRGFFAPSGEGPFNTLALSIGITSLPKR